MENYDILKQKAEDLGAELFGVTETTKLDSYMDPEIKAVARSLPFTVSLGIRLQRKVFDTLQNGPNILYKHHYRTANFKLDQIIFGYQNGAQPLDDFAVINITDIVEDMPNKFARFLSITLTCNIFMH